MAIPSQVKASISISILDTIINIGRINSQYINDRTASTIITHLFWHWDNYFSYFVETSMQDGFYHNSFMQRKK